MVGLDIMASLGLSREQAGSVFHNSTCDGVYALQEEQVKGGGCLSSISGSRKVPKPN